MKEVYYSRIVEDMNIGINTILKDIESSEIMVNNDNTDIRIKMSKKRNINPMNAGYILSINLNDVISDKNKVLTYIKKQLLKDKIKLMNSKEKRMSLTKYKKIDNDLKEFINKYTDVEITKLKHKREFMLHKLDRWFK